MVDSYIQKNKRDREERIIQAYMTAAWQRAKKMPELDKFLKDLEEKERRNSGEPQTPESMLEVVKMLNAQFGGTTY